MKVTVAVLVSVLTLSSGLKQALFSSSENTRLLGQEIRSQRTDSIMTCAHYCIMEKECASFNFKSSLKQGTCELNWQAKEQQDAAQPAEIPGWSFAHLIRQPKPIEPIVHVTFTCLNGKGSTGPDSTAAYQGTHLEGNVHLTAGIQVWTTPLTGSYDITALGASGGNGTNRTSGAGWRLGGRGAKIKGLFYLSQGTKLKILVGQQGLPCKTFPIRPGSGGGGTFVTTTDNMVLVIAGGGGGGAGISLEGVQCKDGDPGQARRNGSRHGGSGGHGGKQYDYVAGFNPRNFGGSGGGGLYGDGSGSVTTTGGHSFTNGGRGGKSKAGGADGGFGGGGAATSHPGGGGGYSGGGVIGDRQVYAVAGGGGSFNNGSMQMNESGINEGNGLVIIKLIH